MPRHVSIGWGIRRDRGSLWTRNAVKGISVHGEKRKKDGRNEWRKWDARRSKVAAMLIRAKSDPSGLIPDPGSLCIYLGASSGSTVSHLHDHVCGAGNHHSGKIIAIDISPRMMRDLVVLCDKRPGLVPVLGDARSPNSITPLLSRKADWLFQDLSMADQMRTFIKCTRIMLSKGGLGIISLKAASERWTFKSDEDLFTESERVVRESEHLEFLERIDLKGLEEQHIVIVARRV
ncbi:MAG: hypothetical protein CMB42_03330 [Euryarchaeota archaeon]|nr:hypothetical protein [Euryarchaeota archaeon]|tara:strand:- start:25955 stop:26656 length:702 start_codon:yes stop_codon:yes gene_type:complete